MARIRKYLNLTDTDIQEIINNFETIVDVVDSTEFYSYIQQFHKLDLKNKKYDKVNIIKFCGHIHNFIRKKRDKLRVKTGLKLNKESLFSLIFEECDIELTEDLKFQISILFEFCFSKHEIYDHVENMEDNYKAMYAKYLTDYDLSNM